MLISSDISSVIPQIIVRSERVANGFMTIIIPRASVTNDNISIVDYDCIGNNSNNILRIKIIKNLKCSNHRKIKSKKRKKEIL